MTRTQLNEQKPMSRQSGFAGTATITVKYANKYPKSQEIVGDCRRWVTAANQTTGYRTTPESDLCWQICRYEEEVSAKANQVQGGTLAASQSKNGKRYNG